VILPQPPEGAVKSRSWQEGRGALNRPVWPLCQLSGILFLAGPYKRFQELLEELPNPVQAGEIRYEDPAGALEPFLHLLALMEHLKQDGRADSQTPPLFTPEGDRTDPVEGTLAWIKQRVLERELDVINAKLCGPCRCTLCCTGPERHARQEYFEIPLKDSELDLFPTPRIDTEDSRSTRPDSEPALTVNGAPFYTQEPAIYRWLAGWSLILTRETRCPHLEPKGGCAIYPDRPGVCRKPQIFPVVIEEAPSSGPGGSTRATLRNTLLAVWDCPYVRTLKEDIVRFAERTGLNLVFKENKA